MKKNDRQANKKNKSWKEANTQGYLQKRKARYRAYTEDVYKQDKVKVEGGGYPGRAIKTR